jgi:four helix bundle protein
LAIPESFQERAFRFAVHILKFYRVILGTTDLPRHLAHQMLRAGTSIAANLEEAKSAYSRRDLAAKQTVALREARECSCWLRLIMIDQPHLRTTADPMVKECNELVATLTASVRRLRTATGRDRSERAP